jgi:hypothetical protein
MSLVDLGVYLAFSIAGAYATADVVKGTGEPPALDPDTETVTLRPGRIYRRLGWVCVVFGGFVWWIGMQQTPHGFDDPGGWVGFVFTFAVVAILFFLYARRHRVELSSKGIVQHTLYGRTHWLLWHDIREIKFFEDGIVRLTGPESVIRVSTAMSGMEHFWNTVAANVDESLWATASRLHHEYIKRGGPARPT